MTDAQRKQKQKENFKKSIEKKNRLASLTRDKRMFNCSRPRTFSCPSCQAISLKHAIVYMCGKRTCPVCGRLQSTEKTEILQESTLSIMRDYYLSGTPVIPISMVFTIPHLAGDSLEELIKTLIEAWRKTRKGKCGEFWQSYFLGEYWTLEAPFNEKSRNGFNPHIHCLAIRYAITGKINTGVDRWTGVIEKPKSGLRSWWDFLLRKTWEKYMSRPYPSYRFGFDREGKENIDYSIEQAIKRIDKSTIYDFDELVENKRLSNKEKENKLEKIKEVEKKRFREKALILVGKRIAPKVQIKSVYFQVKKINKKTGKKETTARIPVSWFLQKEILNSTKIN